MLMTEAIVGVRFRFLELKKAYESKGLKVNIG